MNERILRVLEYQKIIDQLSTQAATTLGKALVAKVKPSTDPTEVIELQKETDEAAQVVRLNAAVPFGGIADIRASIKRSVIGGVLNSEECLDVAGTIYGGRQLKMFVENLEEERPILEELAERITPLRELEREIKSCIDDHGHIMDSASQKLRSIRSSIRTLESRVRDHLDNYTKTKGNMLSDAIVTIRNNRYVLPVKQEHRGSIGGIVHDQSASGQTLFMEPRTVVDLNNQLQELKGKEIQEIERILRDLSDQIAGQEAILQENVEVLAKMDFMFARAKLGQTMRAAMPKINDRGFIKLEQARHPLISNDEVVPNDVEIGGDYTAMVITGPNTGGKTVTLKMVGLSILMAQSGLQIPALDGCEIAVFDQVYADIGDEQSIEQNLSTFSSHMTNIVDILDHVDHKSFVMFDELGAGTDPQEGAALAMAILDDVIARGARVIATTHYPELKAYGYNRKQVINASVEFDIDTLKPTYHLLTGVPGRSNAFEISGRLGLDESVIGQAKGQVGVESNRVETMIASLEKSQLDAQKDYQEAHENLLESEKLLRDLEKQWRKLEDQRESLYKKAEEKADKALQKAREEAEEIVEEIRSMKTSTQLKEHEWIEARKMLEEARPDLSAKRGDEKEKPTDSGTPKELQPGDEIKLLSANQKGTVLEKISDKEYLVQVGIMKVKVKRENLQPLGKQEKQQAERQVATIKGSGFHVKTELDLRGERFEDALSQLEKYVDDVLLAGYSKASIIHGKGTGALRKGVQDFAKQHPSITSARPGGSGEGGSGVTVIEFR